MTTDKIKLIVIDEHTLAYSISDSMAGILRTSVLKGSNFNEYDNVSLDGHKVRLASEKDFDNFRVSFKGFDNKEEYEYKEI